MYIPGFIKTGSGFQTLIGGIHREHGDLIRLLLFCQNKESRQQMHIYSRAGSLLLLTLRTLTNGIIHMQLLVLYVLPLLQQRILKHPIPLANPAYFIPFFPVSSSCIYCSIHHFEHLSLCFVPISFS
jgi:hypothetical protein